MTTHFLFCCLFESKRLLIPSTLRLLVLPVRFSSLFFWFSTWRFCFTKRSMFWALQRRCMILLNEYERINASLKNNVVFYTFHASYWHKLDSHVLAHAIRRHNANFEVDVATAFMQPEIHRKLNDLSCCYPLCCIVHTRACEGLYLCVRAWLLVPN